LTICDKSHKISIERLEELKQKFNVVFFETANGQVPAEDFLLSLNTMASAKMYRLLRLLEDNGNALREPYSKLLRDGIFELRAKDTSGAIRILYFFYVERTIVVTNGFIKKAKKTPVGEIERAIAFRNEFLLGQKSSK
jgi:phage-related protein